MLEWIASSSVLILAVAVLRRARAGLKERILLIAKRPRTAVYAVVILILAAIAAMGCTFALKGGAGDDVF